MKKTILFIMLISMASSMQVSALWTNKTMTFGGLTRSYRVYQSPNYNASNPASLLIALHGLGDNMTNFSGIGFHLIADTANIICVYPQAATDPLAGTAWNSRAGLIGYYPNSAVDDIGFINAIIDTAFAEYSIDMSRVYICGFSMGGFMTQRMALESNLRLAAVASMSGTVGSGIASFNPGRLVPVAHFHGTLDSTVYYAGNLYGIDADSLIHAWVINNGCNPIPTTYSYPNLVNDNITIDRYEYTDSNRDSEVWFYKMTGATHTILFNQANDISEPIEVWLFLRRHTLSNAGITDKGDFNDKLNIYPNPANNEITVSFTTADIPAKALMSVYSLQGQLLFQQSFDSIKTKLDLRGFTNGIYILKVNSNNNIAVRSIVKE